MSTLFITDDGDEELLFELDGKPIGTANHEEYGWAGLRKVIELVTAVAEAGGIPVVNTQDIA